MKLSYNEATGKEASSLELDLVLCEQAGFDFIEIRLDMLRDYLGKRPVSDLKEFFSSHHLKPHAFNGVYIFNEMLSGTRNTDLQREKQVLDDFMLCCEVGREIENRYCMIVPDLNLAAPNTCPNLHSYENTFLDSVRILTHLSDIAQDYDMNLCLEPIGSLGSAVKTITHGWEIIQAVGRKNVGLALDCYNLYLYGKLNDFSAIKSISPEKIFVVHVNNVDDIPLGFIENKHRRFCDRGDINLENFLGVLRDVGYDGMVSIEVFRPEYWAMDPSWIIKEAYMTTKKAVEQYGIPLHKTAKNN